MRIDPLPQQPPGEPFFVTHADRTTLQLVTIDKAEVNLTGSIDIIRFLLENEDHVFYSLVDFMELVECVHPKYWRITRHAERYVKAEFRYPGARTESKGYTPSGNPRPNAKVKEGFIGPTFYPIASFTKRPEEIIPFFESIASLGIKLGSLSTMARSSWRRMLPDSLIIGEHAVDGSLRAGRGAFVGGRRETLRSPATFLGAAYVDLPAAYLRAMHGLFPTQLVPSSGWHEHGIARARIEVPPSNDWHPIPATRIHWGFGVNVACFGWGEAIGYWTFEELRYARERECKVEILESWQGINPRPLFDNWLNWALALRSETGPSGAIAKAFTNRLWATFGTNSRRKRTEMTFNDDEEPQYRTLNGIPGSAETVFVAAITSARNRVALRVLTETGAVLLDTDGGILPLDASASLELRGWKRKGEMSRLEIMNPQFYRYKCMEGIRQHWPIDGCVNCYQDRWHTFRDGHGYEDTVFVPAQPFSEFFAA